MDSMRSVNSDHYRGDPCGRPVAGGRNERFRSRPLFYRRSGSRRGRFADHKGRTYRGPPLSLLTILLNAGGAQTRKAMAVDGVLPSQEFLHGERISAAGLFKRKKAATHRRNNLGLAANHPALRSRRRKVGDRERTSIRPDDILHPRAVGLVHATLTHFKLGDT